VSAWYGGIFGGLLPILLLGFLYSAIADRTVFFLWALVAGAFWVAALRQGLAAGWGRFRLLAALALVLAVGFAIFAVLEWQHHEILDLGFRAVFPTFYHPLTTAPQTAGILAGACALAGAVLFLLNRKLETR
jgi:heme/copper-type cytochrome/quinol oxidase subunit 3